jgi:hypothetical protein
MARPSLNIYSKSIHLFIYTNTKKFSRDLAALGFTPEACNDAADALLAAVDERGQRAYWRLVKASLVINLSSLEEKETRMLICNTHA